MEFWDSQLLGSTMLQWLYFLITAIVAFGVCWMLRGLFVRRFAVLAIKSQTSIDDCLVEVLKKTKLPLLMVFALYAGSYALPITAVKVTRFLDTLAFIALLIQAAIWVDTLILFWVGCYQKEGKEADPARTTTVRASAFVVRLLLYSVTVLLALDNIPGVEITTLIASLGIGGIAVALAVQSILVDLFASLTIAMDKPFVLGDFIIVGDYMGTVEHIGIKTTRIRSLAGEQIVFGNSDLLSSRVRNYKRMEERRVVFSLSVTYQTPHDRVQEIPGMIREVVEAREDVRFDRAHFKSFGESGLDFEVVYILQNPDYTFAMDTQQAINLELLKRFEEKEIGFAYPTRTVHLEGLPEPAKVTRIVQKKTKTTTKAKTTTAAKKTGVTKVKSRKKK